MRSRTLSQPQHKWAHTNLIAIANRSKANDTIAVHPRALRRTEILHPIVAALGIAQQLGMLASHAVTTEVDTSIARATHQNRARTEHDFTSHARAGNR
jgi:hypothetical protein